MCVCVVFVVEVERITHKKHVFFEKKLHAARRNSVKGGRREEVIVLCKLLTTHSSETKMPKIKVLLPETDVRK